MADKCYMCDKDAVSREHVPPQCIFPEKKDLEELGFRDIDLRKDLVTVPACADHNMRKSQDDEYALHIFSMNHKAQGVGVLQFLTKIRRRYERRPKLVENFLNSATPAQVADGERTYETGAVPLDVPRLNGFIDMMGRGIYFHHFGSQWKGDLFSVIEFMEDHGPNSEKLNLIARAVVSAAKTEFEKLPKHGENPNVFWYSAIELNHQGIKGVIIRMCFYGGAFIDVLFFKNDEMQTYIQRRSLNV